MRNRAFRRHNHEKAIKKTEKFAWVKAILEPRWRPATEEDKKTYEKMVRRHCENRKKCSCESCRNPRRSDWNKTDEKMTLQERRTFPLKKELDFSCD
jgi:hypothetical protein